ncbi:hypothetical protein FHX52_2770 [Humibacillus xanthopallidus]|uniref:Hpr(Ser) kinase/phosphatase n=1 Tax=Humibacillus xanthopallidus TaxID=412689 RepID=A0A543PPQ7_9MICO|nr:hypothetical protein [Humibacillus xanthopallidus]TQN46064.1 hypothetical protein FHX52_2770 [Humibacillus xanthopallidus]
MSLRTSMCGLTVDIGASTPRWSRLVERALGGPTVAADDDSAAKAADLVIHIEDSRSPFPVGGLAPVTRGAWAGDGTVVLEDACGSGVDLRLQVLPPLLVVTARPRPAARHRLLRAAAPGRTELLHRAAVLQFPALWWAGCTGAVPLHVSAAQVGELGVALAGAGGVGKSTLLGTLLPAQGRPVSDNVCVWDGRTLWALPEPRRVTPDTVEPGQPAQPGGRTSERSRHGRMPHGREEREWASRQPGVEPSLVLVVTRGTGNSPSVAPVTEHRCARMLVGGTYAAGELGRYWAFAATLALATGIGPAHPPVTQAAERLSAAVPCVRVELAGRRTSVPLVELVERAAALARPLTGSVR